MYLCCWKICSQFGCKASLWWDSVWHVPAKDDFDEDMEEANDMKAPLWNAPSNLSLLTLQPMANFKTNSGVRTHLWMSCTWQIVAVLSETFETLLTESYHSEIIKNVMTWHGCFIHIIVGPSVLFCLLATSVLFHSSFSLVINFLGSVKSPQEHYVERCGNDLHDIRILATCGENYINIGGWMLRIRWLLRWKVMRAERGRLWWSHPVRWKSRLWQKQLCWT